MNLHETARNEYFKFPTTGFTQGCNLGDVVSGQVPYFDLDTENPSYFPYTVKVK
jgi:hypothetical protein